MIRTFAGSFSRKAVATTLAAALTFTSAGVAPARADGNGDAIAAAAFFGLVAVGIIASTRDSRDSHARSYHPPLVTQPRHLPGACRFDIRHGRDRGTWYGRNCLAERNIHVWSLPNACQEHVRLPGRHHDVIAYSAQCLTRIESAQHGHGRDDRGPGKRD